MHAGDRTSHLVSDGAIRGVPLAARAELDQVQCLSRVKLEDVADPVRKRERIRRLFDEAFRAQSLVFHARDVKRTLELAAEPCAHELVRKVGTEVRREPLPLAGQQTMALQVAERAVVGDDLEAVRQRLEAATRTVAPVLAFPDELAQQCATRICAKRCDRAERVLLARLGRLEQQCREQLLFGAVHAEEAHRRRSACRSEAEPAGRRVGCFAAIAQELDPAAAPVLARHADDEARDDPL